MNRSSMNRTMMVAAGLIVVLALFAFTGCGKKAPVVDDPAAGQGNMPVETLPAEPVPETNPANDQPATPDYTTMDPREYGVEDVFFAFDQYELDNESMSALAANARAIKEAGTVVLISGHCDERGTVEYNLALGEKRANAVRDYLVSLGVPAARLRVTSYGENRPFAFGSDEDSWAQNRRAHFARP